MIVRQAHFVGTITAGTTEAFYAFVRDRLMPMWQNFPGLERLEVFFPQSADPGASPIALSLSMYFADQAALEMALESAIRQESRGVTAELLTRFDGRVEHHIMRVEALAPVLA